jgi:hypothetical protein
MLDAEGEKMMRAARAGYEAYAKRSGWKSLVTGDPLPQWRDLGGPIANGWYEAAVAITESLKQP